MSAPVQRWCRWGMLLWLCWTGAARASDGMSLDLAQFVEQAELHDPGIAAARADMVVGQEGRLRARAGMFPRIEASWSANRTRQQYDGLPAQQYENSQRQITLTQPLFDASIWSNYREAEAQEARKQLQWLQASQALRIKAVERYFAALAARDEAALNAELDQALQRQLSTAKKRQRAGEATLIDISDIEAELARSANALANARTREQVRLRELELMLGQRIGALAGLPAGLGIPQVYPDDISSWTLQAMTSHPEVQLRDMDRKLAAVATDRARMDFLPKASLQASIGRSGATTSGFISYPQASTNSIGIQLTIPLFSGGETVYAVRQGLAQAQKAEHDAEQARRQVQTEVAESFAQAQSQRRSSADLERYVATLERALEATQIGYRMAGNRRESDVLQKQNALWSARRELLQARYEALVQGLRLKALTASLGVADISAVSALLAP